MKPNRRFLVTAGNTRERIDDVRDWGNIFTGNTGFDIAHALSRLGPVDLITSNKQHQAMVHAGLGTPFPVTACGFGCHAELKGALAAMLAGHDYDAAFMTAAVADYRPVRTFRVEERSVGGQPGEEIWRVIDVQAGKVKSNHPAIAILGEQTEKLVDLFRKDWNHCGLLFKFKLEVGISQDDLIRIGQASRVASGADFLVANTLAMVGGPQPGAYLLSSAGEEWIARANLATRLAEVVERRLAVSPAPSPTGRGLG